MTSERKYDSILFYDEVSMSKILPFFHAISILAIIFNFILIVIIINKTPKIMKGFKIFLLPYACSTFFMEILFAIYVPTILHPFAFIYPVGLIKNASPNFSYTIFMLCLYYFFSILDCSSGMILERFFAIHYPTKNSKMPLIIFGIFAFNTFSLFIFTQILYYNDSIKTLFLMPRNQIENALIKHLTNTSMVNCKYAIAPIGGDTGSLPWPANVVAVCTFIRGFLILILLILNIIKSQNLPSSMLSSSARKQNSMLLRVAAFQFFGFAFLLCLPTFVILIVFLFSKEPQSFTIFLLIGIFNFFGLYDSLITVIFIKPYRDVFLNSFKIFGLFKNSAVSPFHSHNL